MNGHHPVAIPVLGVTALVTALALTPTDIATIIGAVAILVGALGTASAAIISALGKRIKEVKTDIGDVKTEMVGVKAKVDVVEGHVNSNTTKLETTNAALLEQIAILKEERADKRQVAAVLAQAVTVADVTKPKDNKKE